MKKLVVFTLLVILSLPFAGAGCSSPATEPSAAPTTTTPTHIDMGFTQTTRRDVPTPVPCPWPGVTTYTEQTYEIDVSVGEEFAIGMFATVNTTFGESHDTGFLELLGKQLVPYDPVSLNKYGTEWFLYKATKTGTTEINYNYPIEYMKVFEVVIH